MRERLNSSFMFHGSRAILALFIINQFYRAPYARVTGCRTAVVASQTFLQISGPATVKAAIAALQEIAIIWHTFILFEKYGSDYHDLGFERLGSSSQMPA